MDAELKAKWTAALRSGEFKQASGRLKKGEAYCCLGVLAAVNGLPFDGGDPYEPLDQILGGDKRGDLVTMNDFRGNSFAEIADWIDANL